VTAAAAPPPEAEPVIVTDRLSRRFGSLVAVRDVSLVVRRGEIFGVLGPNGAGKSTTIRMLCGILDPSSGGGRVVGFDITRDAERIDLLRATPGVAEVAHYGRLLRVATHGGADPAALVGAALAPRGLAAVGVRAARVTVEDAFVFLVRQGGRAPDGGEAPAP
jgi:energy-coupling factor transporter ATP-binding protein EcfA2